MIYLIQGIWFQELSRAGIAIDGGDLIAVMRTALVSAMYMGVLMPHKDNTEELIGSTVDQAGHAAINEGILSDTAFSFWKQYTHRRDRILYRFQKQPDGIWSGQYFGQGEVGRGYSRCVLTPVSKEFFVAKY